MNKKVSLIVGGSVIILAALTVLCCGAVLLFGAVAPDPELLRVTRLPPTVQNYEDATVTPVLLAPTSIPTLPPAATLPPATSSAEVPPGIPGLEHGRLRLNLKDIGFECKPIDSIRSGGQTVTVSGCQKQDSGYLMGIDTASRNPNDLDQIKAYVVFTGEPDPTVAETFLGMIAALPYDGADTEAARDWVKENLPAIQSDTDIKTAWFGPVHFELSGNDQVRNLRVGSYLGVSSSEQ